MGLHETVLVFWLVFTELVAGCPQTYEEGDSDKQMCSYNLKLYENNSASEMLIALCDVTEMVYSNKTYNRVAILLPVACKSRFLNINYPSLVANAIEARYTNLTIIKINIDIQYLKIIDLSSNKLKNIEKGVYNLYINLKELNLRNNNIQYIREESFSGLIKLEILDLSNNDLKVINNIFVPLKGLLQLNLSKNHIEFIHENSFNNFLLQTLDISYNKLKEVGPGVLLHLPSLVRLLLSDNNELAIAQHDIQLLVGSGRWLQQIDASRTGLHRIPQAFTHSFRFLSLTGNRLAAVRCGDFDSYPLLQSLDLSDNEIDFVEDDSLGRLEMLILLNLNSNRLTSVPKSLTEELIYLSMNGNLIKNLTKMDFDNLRNLNVLLLQSNKISYVEGNTFTHLLALKVLDLSNNPIQTLPARAFEGPLALLDLRLCYLNVSVPETDGAFPMTAIDNLQMLHLKSSPYLARQLLTDSAALTALSHLHYWDLRMNNLSEIRIDLLFYLEQLKTLRLHGNGFNCSAELWQKDWLNWNTSGASGETCYYDNADLKGEVECGCSFSGIFTSHSDSLTPINLYSNEIIHKLMKHYDDCYKIKDITENNKFATIDKVRVNEKAKNLTSVYLTKAAELPSKIIKNNETKSISTLSDPNRLLEKENIRSELNSSYHEVIQYSNKLSLGRRWSWNTPDNITIVQTNENLKQHIKQTNDPKNGSNTVENNIHGEENIKKSEYSRNISDREYFASFIWMGFVLILVIGSLVLIIQLKQRRKSIIKELEQIEVAYISEGMWEDVGVAYQCSSVESDTLVK